jgi:hypothetical protein
MLYYSARISAYNLIHSFYLAFIIAQSPSIIWGLYNRPEVAVVPSGLSPTPLIKKRCYTAKHQSSNAPCQTGVLYTEDTIMKIRLANFPKTVASQKPITVAARSKA